MIIPSIFNEISLIRAGTRRKYECWIYKNNELFEIYGTDSDSMVSRIEEMAESFVESLKKRNSDDVYSLRKQY